MDATPRMDPRSDMASASGYRWCYRKDYRRLVWYPGNSEWLLPRFPSDSHNLRYSTSSLQTAVLFSPIKRKNSPSIDEDTYTQFAYACKQLGVELGSSSVPQAKGRVERLNQTLQSRLPGHNDHRRCQWIPKLLHKGIQWEVFLPIHGIKSVFEVQPGMKRINLTSPSKKPGLIN